MKILFVDKVHSFLHEKLIKNGYKCVNAFDFLQIDISFIDPQN